MNQNNPPKSTSIPSHIKIDHLGAKDCVTGSCHLVRFRTETNDSVSILVDCGSAYGHDPEVPFAAFPVSPETIDYLFLTHAHIDHIGRVPALVDAGFRGEIICTHATKALLVPMLHDAMSFSGRSKNKIQRLEAYIDELSWGFELYETFTLKKGITFNLKNAGHILGSCFIQFIFPGNASNDRFKVTFSGDLGCTDTPILPDPDRPDSCDLLVLESTYGDRLHPSRKDRAETLRKLLKMALADKGIVYIPAFALGRTQELLYELDRIGVEAPVFVDSPLGIEITEIYAKLDNFWDKEAKALQAKGDHPFDFKGLYGVRKYTDHQRLLDLKGPAIIIAGSGMCTGGRIVDHLEYGLHDPLNDIFFVGYQAKGTLGRQIIERKVPVKAGVYSLTAYSAHADQQMIVDWVHSMPTLAKEIRLVHGEEKAQEALGRLLLK